MRGSGSPAVRHCGDEPAEQAIQARGAETALLRSLGRCAGRALGAVYGGVAMKRSCSSPPSAVGCAGIGSDPEQILPRSEYGARGTGTSGVAPACGSRPKGEGGP